MKICGNCKHCYVGECTGITLCRLSKKDVIGYFAAPCEHYENNQEQPKTRTSTAMEYYTTPAKVCKICGRTLPLDSFPKHPRTKDGHSHICAECLKAKNASSIQAAIDARKKKKEVNIQVDALPDGIHKVVIDPAKLEHYTDQQLYDELIRRGWTGTLTRTETLGGEQ